MARCCALQNLSKGRPHILAQSCAATGPKEDQPLVLRRTGSLFPGNLPSGGILAIFHHSHKGARNTLAEGSKLLELGVASGRLS